MWVCFKEGKNFMFVICKNKTIDLSKFETVKYRESLVNDGFPVEAIRHEVGFWGTTEVSEEIARMTYQEGAALLVKDITKALIDKKEVFDLEAWRKEKS